jgi:hypothetical protein
MACRFHFYMVEPALVSARSRCSGISLREPSSRFYAGGGGSHLWTLPRRRAERHGGSPVLKSSKGNSGIATRLAAHTQSTGRSIYRALLAVDQN